jgi:hypothetical protein
MNTGHGIAIAGLFVGMGLCIHAGAYLGAIWLIALYIAGLYLIVEAKKEQLKNAIVASKEVVDVKSVEN